MVKTNNVLIISAFLAACFLLLFPGTVIAQTVCSTSMPACDPNDCACINQQLQCAQMQQAQDMGIVLSNFFNAMPRIDLDLYNCLTQIDNILSQTNGPGLIGGGFLDSLIDGVIGQACGSALSIIQQTNNFILSQVNRLCIPLPTPLNMNVNLGLPTPACNGTPLIGFQPTYGNTSGNGSTLKQSIWQMFNWNNTSTGQ